MLKYAKIENEESKVCSVGIDTNNEVYSSLGMTLMEVEQAYNGLWYVKGYAPKQSQEEINAQTQARLTQAIQDHLDTKAQELNYDSCLSVCSYVDTGVEKFDAEGKAFRAWRSAVWNKGYEILNACLAGEREVPTEAELIAELPELNVDYS